MANSVANWVTDDTKKCFASRNLRASFQCNYMVIPSLKTSSIHNQNPGNNP